jgi:hypothetical protein
MNKFEALKTFQAWPPEWQRLCAEYWIETGEDRPAVASPVPSEPFPYGQPVSRQVIQCNADAFPFDQPRAVAMVAHKSVAAGLMQEQPKAAAKVAVKPARNFMRYTRDELTEVDSHVSEGRGPSEVARIMDKKYPKQRTIDAWEKMANRIKKVGLQAMLDRAIDVEFK